MTPLDALPRPSGQRLAVRVTPDAIRQIRGGHPWVFDRSVTNVKAAGRAEGTAGDLAVIFDADREFVAIGLYDPTSPIRIRILHHGRPVTIDDAWWSQRLSAAVERRAVIVGRGDTTGYRVIHGENDGFSGLVLDRYDSTFVLKLYSAAWLPHLPMIVSLLESQLQPDALVLRLSRDLSGQPLFGLSEGLALVGTTPSAPVLFREHGLLFEADVVHGQKTGHFLDQRDNRNRVRSYAKDANVLDVFACTGGFSVYAAAGGATSVRSIDLSANALATAERNMAHNAFINRVRNCNHTVQVGDAFEVMRTLFQQQRRFDIVIVDPPSFARKQADHDRAIHAYQRLTKAALGLVEDGGILVQSSCSSRVSEHEFFEVIHATARRERRTLAEMLRTGHAADHPIGFPEGSYLKTLFARVGG